MLKGWSVVLISGLFALAAKDAKPLALVALFPCLLFWGLDGYFLWQERLFRGLYNKVRVADLATIDYSLKHIEDGYSYGKCFNEWLNAVVSKTLFTFYGTVFLTIIAVMVVLAKF